MTEIQLSTRAHLRLTGYLLVTWCAWITVWSLVPFQVVDSWAQVNTNLYELLTVFTRQPIIRSVIEHVGFTFPIGLWGYVWLTNHRTPKASRVCLLGAMVYLVLLEIAQCFFGRRHASIFDVSLSSVGVWVGIMIARWTQRVEPAYERCLIQNRGVIYSMLAGLGLMLMCYMSVIAHTQVNIEKWDTRFPLLVGNELSSNRAWMGGIKGLAIYDRALTLSEAAALSERSFNREYANERVGLGAEVIYDFTDQPQERVIRQIVPSDPPLDLLLPSPDEKTWRYREGVLEIVKPTLIRTKSFSKRLASAASMENELSVELVMKAASLDQEGPARMVSMSHGISLANFMVGQQESRIDFRVRTPRTGVNGGRRICRSIVLDLTDGWHHVVATYNGGVENIFVDGQLARRPLYLYAMSQVVLRADWPGASVVAALICFVPIGFAIGAGCKRKAHLINILNPRLGAVMVPLLVLAYCAKLYGHEYDVVFTVASIMSAIGGSAWAYYLSQVYSAGDQFSNSRYTQI